MAEVVTETLSTVPSGPILDATIGGGGHSYEILKSRDDLNIIGIDQDPEALAAAESKLMGFENRVSLIHGRFDDLSVVAKHIGKQKLSGFLFDLGVSSYQLDNPHRGFSFRNDGPLDMRMNPDTQITAGKYVNDSTEQELASLLYNYGDERYSKTCSQSHCFHAPYHEHKRISKHNQRCDTSAL